jgi:protein-S-isoprenylcysteine O-methyltransferase Ste14
MLILKGLVGVLFQVALFAAFLLIPAGTWDWPRAIQFLVVYGLIGSVSVVLLAIFSPASLEARLESPVSTKQPIEDRVATVILISVIAAWFIFVPIDVFRLKIFAAPVLGVSVVGALIGLSGYCIILLTIYQNKFAIPVVRDQAERGQTLVDTGLYGLVRHPMYSGLLVMLAGTGMWLESYASVVTLIVVLAALVPRILIEEKMLKNNLPGYPNYMSTVRYRLVPFIW